MSEDTSLFAWADQQAQRAMPPPQDAEDAGAITRAFWQFHRENPNVYRELVRLARQMKGAGRTRYGIASLFEVVRWHRALVTTDLDFKINNSYRSRYARLIMDTEPDLKDFFETRRLHSD